MTEPSESTEPTTEAEVVTTTEVDPSLADELLERTTEDEPDPEPDLSP